MCSQTIFTKRRYFTCRFHISGKEGVIEMKGEFKDLCRYEPYEYLNSEITGDYDKAYAVKCVNGAFIGTEENGVASWLGIPYAKPPVGERRFKAPEYVDESDGVFEAKYYGKCAFAEADRDGVHR